MKKNLHLTKSQNLWRKSECMEKITSYRYQKFDIRYWKYYLFSLIHWGDHPTLFWTHRGTRKTERCVWNGQLLVPFNTKQNSQISSPVNDRRWGVPIRSFSRPTGTHSWVLHLQSRYNLFASVQITDKHLLRKHIINQVNVHQPHH